MSVLSSIQRIFPTPHIMSFPSVGVDVSDTSLKYIQFDRPHHGDDLRIAYYGDIDIPKNTVERGNVYDLDKLITVLEEVRERTGTKYVRMSLPEERAYLFETIIDKTVALKDIRGVLDFKLEENVPLSAKDAHFDYVIIGRDHETHNLRVVVTVYTITTIQHYYEACIRAKLFPISFEIESQAISRAIIPHTHNVSNETYMVLDFGKTRMGVGIVSNNILMYTSTIEIAGEQMSADMREILGDIPEADITHIKNTRGLAHTNENKKIAHVLEKYAESIAEEVGIRIQYWNTRDINKNECAIKKIILSGGSVNLFGLPEFLTEKLSIPTERAQVWVNAFSLDTYIPPISRRHSYGYATAAGLALIGINNHL